MITGGGGMLGIKHAEAIAEAGGTAVLVDVNAERAQKAERHIREVFGGESVGIQTDVTDKQQITDTVAAVKDRYGRIDVLINNVALTVEGGGAFDQYFAPFADYPEELFNLALNVNLTGTFLMTQAVGEVMVAQERGVIVNIASDVAMISPDHRIYEGVTNKQGQTFNTPISYSMSKAAILAFTRYLATYWADKGIRVNALSPAGVYDDHDPEFVKRLSNLIPLGRMARKDEYKGAILFLSSEASSFMTGANLVVDGGRTSW